MKTPVCPEETFLIFTINFCMNPGCSTIDSTSHFRWCSASVVSQQVASSSPSTDILLPLQIYDVDDDEMELWYSYWRRRNTVMLPGVIPCYNLLKKHYAVWWTIRDIGRTLGVQYTCRTNCVTRLSSAVLVWTFTVVVICQLTLVNERLMFSGCNSAKLTVVDVRGSNVDRR